MSNKQPKLETLDGLRKIFPRGSTVYTILRSRSRSGLRRTIGVVGLRSVNKTILDYHPNHDVAEALGLRCASGDGVIVHGAGMDMGFHLVHSLSVGLYGDGYALKHRWL